MTLGPKQQAWINALRSGNYRQTKYYLNNSEGYCCLGVACEIFKNELNLKKTEYKEYTNYNDLTSSLPLEVDRYLKLKRLKNNILKR